MQTLTVAMRHHIEDFLAQFAGTKAVFVPNEGNVGDCLIFAATMNAFAKASIDVDVVDKRADFRNCVVFLGGGGNLVGAYRGMRETIEACRQQADRIILLPHTIRANVDLLKSLDDRATIWCRDLRSFQHVRQSNPSLDCQLAHDMAFHCDIPQFMSDEACNRAGTAMLAEKLALHRTSLDKISSLPVVRFMRTDREARSSHIQTDLDVSRAFGCVTDAETSRLAAWCFVKTISVANRVLTDRLHVAIACALLEVDCELVDNSYNKNREIYAHSLNRFDWVSFSKTGNVEVPDIPSAKLSLVTKVARRTQRFRDRWLSGASR